ncbi:MAG: acylphosphatase [Candidatus Omnitrophica bacterium]|nr:acylphosphatase [Candidatus Omnitrophota bacterium]
MVRSHVFFSGTVQGVGFRYTAVAFARELKVNGWVKNLPDGRVEMMAEGSRERIENFIYKLDKQYAGKIAHKDIDWLDARGQFSDFTVTY